MLENVWGGAEATAAYWGLTGAMAGEFPGDGEPMDDIVVAEEIEPGEDNSSDD